MLYTIDIEGRAICVFAAGDRSDAEVFCDALAVELSCLDDENGRALWSGEDDELKLNIRGAHGDERAIWDAEVARAVLAGGQDSRESADGDNYVVFLIATIDPSDEAFDEDKDELGDDDAH